ncbi:MAG: hypothetical protein U5J94_04215 [Thiohalophilus sp.]|nr:hypothetical protein [Thiohalophilus sp.]MDZ7661571.1 hypothetical protein [Thiohalophilus sp.]
MSTDLFEPVQTGDLTLANPDLVRRYCEDLPLNDPDTATFYGGDEKGYTDYPFYSSSAQHADMLATDQ